MEIIRRKAITSFSDEGVTSEQLLEEGDVNGFQETGPDDLVQLSITSPTVNFRISMGAFEPPTGFRLSKHTFVGDKGDYYEIDDGLPQSPGY